MSARTPQNPMPPFVGSFIRVGGLPLGQHLQKVSQIPTQLENIPVNIAPQLMNKAKEDAQRIVPVRTGYLRSTIDWDQISRYVFSFFARARYARAVEEGTFRMPARPYMAPAILALRRQAPQLIINEVRKIFH